ncbi:MAG: MFS transporter [Planctomycetes bacterium]|nr:MFS transporter [Planctomycetota bacterium]
MGGSQAVLAVTVAGAFVFGMVIVLLSCLKPQLAGRLNVPEERVAGLWAGMNLLLVPMAFLGGLLADLWDVRVVLLAGCVLIALGLLALRWATTYRGALVAFLVTGVGGGFLSTASIVLMPSAFFGRHEASASLNMGNVFFALGALLAPTLCDVLLRWGGFRRALGTGALLALVPLLLLAVVRREDANPGQPRPDVLELLRDPMLWLAGAVFFLYAPLEGCLHTWGSTYLQNVGHTERKAAHLIAGFWSCFLLGRLAMAYFQHWRILDEHWDPWVVVLLSLCATVTLANLAGTVKRGSATTGLLLLGFFLGPIFPTLIGLLFNHYPNEPGTAFGTMFAIGSAGSVFFAPVIGARFHRTSAQSALRIPLVLGMLLMIVSLFFGLAIG